MFKKEHSKSAYFYLTATILLWSATPAVATLALRELNTYQLLFYTSITGVISLFIINFFQGKLKILLHYTKKDYIKMFGMGFLGIFLYYILLYGSFSLAPAGQVNVINYLWPIFIVVFSVPVLRERVNNKTLLAIIISFLGAFLAFTKGNFSDFSYQHAMGYLLAMLGAICYGLFSVLGKKLEYEKFSSMLVYCVSATILIVPTTLVVSGFVIPTSWTTVIAILVLGGMMNSVTFVFWFKALKYGHTHKTANLIYSVPFLAMVWTYFLNSEPFAIASIIGLVLITIGTIIQLKNNT